LDFYEFNLNHLQNIGQRGSTVNLTLELLESFREERIEKLEEKLKFQIDDIETKLATVIDEQEL